MRDEPFVAAAVATHLAMAWARAHDYLCRGDRSVLHLQGRAQALRPASPAGDYALAQWKELF